MPVRSSLLRTPRGHRRLVNGADQVYLRSWCGAGGDRGAVPRRGGGAAPGAAAGRTRRPPPRRRDAVRRPPALPDGTRFHAVLAPLARPGTLVSLDCPGPGPSPWPSWSRRARSRPARRGSSRPWSHAASRSSSPAAPRSGKTTLLAALLSLVAPEAGRRGRGRQRAASGPPPRRGLEGRPPNIEGAGAVDVRTLVRQALRMRPDRLVVGEVRGAEVVDLLAALNTGHEGGCGTLHANSALDVRPGSRRWPWPRVSVATRRTTSSPRRSASCSTWREGPTGSGDCARWRCRSEQATVSCGWCRLSTSTSGTRPPGRTPRRSPTGWACGRAGRGDRGPRRGALRGPRRPGSSCGPGPVSGTAPASARAGWCCPRRWRWLSCCRLGAPRPGGRRGCGRRARPVASPSPTSGRGAGRSTGAGDL